MSAGHRRSVVRLRHEERPLEGTRRDQRARGSSLAVPEGASRSARSATRPPMSPRAAKAAMRSSAFVPRPRELDEVRDERDRVEIARHVHAARRRTLTSVSVRPSSRSPGAHAVLACASRAVAPRAGAPRERAAHHGRSVVREIREPIEHVRRRRERAERLRRGDAHRGSRTALMSSTSASRSHSSSASTEPAARERTRTSAVSSAAMRRRKRVTSGVRISAMTWITPRGSSASSTSARARRPRRAACAGGARGRSARRGPSP